jgi:phosphatidylserine decarboxylase
LSNLIAIGISPDDRGLFPITPEGRLAGDVFHNMTLKISPGGRVGSSASESDPDLFVRVKFTPYDALRQQFWRSYLPQYDTDESGTFNNIEVFSALEALNSTLAKETINSFYSRFNKTLDQELTTDELIICLEQELLRPLSEKRAVDESPPNTSGLSTPTASDEIRSGFTGITEGSLVSTTSQSESATSTSTLNATPAIERGECFLPTRVSHY